MRNLHQNYRFIGRVVKPTDLLGSFNQLKSCYGEIAGSCLNKTADPGVLMGSGFGHQKMVGPGSGLKNKVRSKFRLHIKMRNPAKLESAKHSIFLLNVHNV